MPELDSARPVLGVGAIVIVEERVLLVRRGREPRKGTWTLPGGRVEPGERLETAVRREVEEETGLTVEPLALVDLFEYIERDPEERVVHHFVVADYWCRWVSGELRAGSDVDDARFVEMHDLVRYALGPEALRMIESALERERNVP